MSKSIIFNPKYIKENYDEITKQLESSVNVARSMNRHSYADKLQDDLNEVKKINREETQCKITC